jgi:murein DD-endopeptidase MepM/ murein hydrolase activator NlpD
MKPSSRPITCPFGRKGSAWATGQHGGVDFGCPVGDTVRAMWGGVVTSASWGPAYGTHIVIDHDRLPDGSPGLWAVYAHLSRKSVLPGDRVEAGDPIGKSGDTGNVSGPHLHVEIQSGPNWRSGHYVNPAPWLAAEP